MCIYMCICVYICVCVCVYMCVYVYMYVYVYIYVYMCIYMCVGVRVYIYLYMYIYVCLYISICIYVYVYNVYVLQLEALQAKQAHILSLKKDAEVRLALVQKEVNFVSLNIIMTSLLKREDLDNAVGPIQYPDTSQQSISEHERELLSQLQEMRNKKAQVEQVLSEVQAIKGN